MTGFKPKETENVPESAIKSLEELAVQCCRQVFFRLMANDTHTPFLLRVRVMYM